MIVKETQVTMYGSTNVVKK